MRVLHWYPNFGGGGGVANAVEELARAQAGLGHEVTIAYAKPRGTRLYQEASNDGVVELRSWAPAMTLRGGGMTVRVLRRADAAAFRTLAPDVVHVHGEFNADNLRTPRLFGAPVILSPQGAFHPVVFAKGRSASKRAYVGLATALLYRHALIHAVTPAECDHVRAAVPAARCYVAPNGAAIRELPRMPPRADGSVVLLFAGRLDVFKKGLDLLLAAFALARDREPALRLVLAGPDWNGGRAELTRLADELGVLAAVEMPGALARDELAAALAATDAYVQLSRYEGFPLAVADALAAGKPAVLSDAVGLASFRELHGLEHIRVVPPRVDDAAAALADVAARIAELRAVGAAAQPELAALFSWDRAAIEHVRQYEAELAARREQAPMTRGTVVPPA